MCRSCKHKVGFIVGGKDKKGQYKPDMYTVERDGTILEAGRDRGEVVVEALKKIKKFITIQ